MDEVVRLLKPDGTFWLAIGDEYAARTEGHAHPRTENALPQLGHLVLHVRCKLQGEFPAARTHLFYLVKNPEIVTFNADSPALRVPPPGSWSMATSGRIPKAGCPTIPGFCARVPPAGYPRIVRPHRRYLVFLPRVRDVQGADRLAHLSNAGTALGADHRGVRVIQAN